MALRRIAVKSIALGCASVAVGASIQLFDFDLYHGKFGDFLRHVVPPEVAHQFALGCARHEIFGFGDQKFTPDDPILECQLKHFKLSNPIGLAAGFDKDATAMRGLLGSGFGFVEVGSITPEPQKGNDKPRVFRLHEDHAIINRYGFNSLGVESAFKRFKDMESSHPHGLIGINVGKNKTTENALLDYERVVRRLCNHADYIVINVSSPNTPGLRMLQNEDSLRSLIEGVIRARNEEISQTRPVSKSNPDAFPPLFVKIAPDLNEDDLKAIAKVALELEIDGLIVSNTTIQRPESLKSGDVVNEQGGLSGQPLFDISTRVLGEMYALTGGKLILIGVGGVSTGEQAYKKIRQGASLVQLYTALVYEGPSVVETIKKELAECLRRDGFSSVKDAIGADHQ
mmetsp:Transcript_7291/g.13153  ORF Transcript_7291/g.13153 Transcript_7291/m.13153 type:complete len:399 (-) Transcript_7291:61-1257(-)|eukprot:CAMPEP_0182447266 /NCGR_PEP_ID=MMETSP1172-20130603/13618_1 /TAXON_ID=708627 /ORGANISM="Timspurckia oligopyrenoides, Strain CCMP3278" /LENGTH=398 /DNA_ID=CAMNT_0024643643 /DNA_START=357 /DNA_END=1553 /DNA_ORIENTATION=+